MVEKSKEYVQAARVTGVHPGRIMFGHVLPNVMGPVLVGGWFLARRKVRRIAAIRHGHTGQFPVVAERPWPGRRAAPEVIVDDER